MKRIKSGLKDVRRTKKRKARNIQAKDAVKKAFKAAEKAILAKSKEVVDLIKKAAAAIRAEIAEDPESPAAYNQFAWLVGNTEGDFDEALKDSQKSLELKPDEGGFYDTLARVYFAKGDLDNAVKHQAKAAELEPHSGLIQRQLDLFRKKREEKK